jgi:hypothetical protein
VRESPRPELLKELLFENNRPDLLRFDQRINRNLTDQRETLQKVRDNGNVMIIDRLETGTKKSRMRA